MSDSYVFSRRDFLRLAGIGVAGAAAGCGARQEKLIPYLVPPENILPGVPYWYASTCRECPVGCGILVKAREGRAIKIEGNPAHPVNRGGLCARGQAGLQGLYDPDRVAAPMLKQAGGWKKIGWDEALTLAGQRIGQANRDHHEVALITEHATGSFEKLSARWAAAAGGTHLIYEPFDYQALREANRRTFGQAFVPHYDFAAARFLMSFGADFLDTWVSPVGHARAFAEMRARHDGGVFVAVEPRLSMTGSNADEWVAIRPGGEMALALGMARAILSQGWGPGVSERGGLLDAVAAYTPEMVESQTDVPAETVLRLARLFGQGQPSLAVAGGVASQSEQAVAMIAAGNLLKYVAGNVGRTLRFDRTLNYDAVGSLNDLQRLSGRMSEGAVGVLVVHGANPVYAVPHWVGFAAALDHVPFKISLSPVLDETAERCDLILPSTHALETLGDAQTARGVYSIIQPAMQRVPMFDARPAGDLLIALAQKSGFGAGFPASWNEAVKAEWRGLHPRFGGGSDFDTFWNQTLQKGGVWEEVSAPSVGWASTPAFAAPEMRGAGEFTVVMYPSASLYDGRGANKAWLQELPDPNTKAVWGSWVEIHPETAARLGIHQGDALKVETDAGSVTLPAHLYGGIRKDVIAIPLGQGHTAYGRTAKGRGANGLVLLPPAQDAASGTVAYLSARAKIAKVAERHDLVRTQREMIQADREIARVIPIAALMGTASEHAGASHGGAAAHEEGHHGPGAMPSQTRLGTATEPRQKPPGEKLPAHAVTAFRPEETVRGPRAIPIVQGNYGTATHRWAMAIDLDSCTGCSACMVACTAENNVPTVGPELIKRGREMWWIRIDRFEHRVGNGANDVRFVPMMCQHCGDAPCEIVCPVYATYHNPEGLNAQVYNRCVGTRYCSNNCPYKVRSFNFFDYAAPEKDTFAFPEPLNWQLNPDVTVRSKGVMEKCTMCIQRILEGKGNARDENRPLREGDIQTACAQTCPTRAITFGDLLDPNSEVSKLSNGGRSYWVLDDLNTKPGVTYLKKIQRAAT